MAVTPVFLSPDGVYPITQPNQYGRIGQYSFGGKRWILCAQVPNISATQQILASYYSTDGGFTWTAGPTGPTIGAGNAGTVSVSYRGAGGLAYLVYYSTGSTSSGHFVSFNMAGSGLFGTPVAIPFALDSADNVSFGFDLRELSTGNLALIWEQGMAPSVWSVSVAIYSGSWSSRLDVNVATVNKRLYQAVVDASDRVGILSRNLANPGQLVYSLTSGTTLVSETTVSNGFRSVPGGEGLTAEYQGLYDSASDSVAFATLRTVTDVNPPFDDLTVVSLIIGTPSAAPVFSFVDLYSIDLQGVPTVTEYLDMPYLVATTAGFTAAWIHGFNWGTPSGNSQIWTSNSATLHGAYSAPALYYDLLTTPFPSPAALGGFFYFWANFTDGSLGITIGMDTAFTRAQGWFSLLGFLAAAAPAPPTLACPVTNTATQGVFFSATMIATGTAPLTFVLLSGPPWLSINSLTGVISGTPTLTGVFSYTVQVTDANGLTATVTCSIGVTLPGTPSGRRPQPITPNTFDGCLGRDFRRYMTIDYGRLGCGRLPDCFRVDEREWG